MIIFKKKKKIFIVILVILILAVGVGYHEYVSTSNNRNSNPLEINNSKKFISANLNISFEALDGFIVKEQAHRILLEKGDLLISISRGGTQFDNLNEYLIDLNNKNQNVVETYQDYTIDNLVAKMQILRLASGERIKTYKIFIKPTVFSISTYNEELYDDLDQIAQSFRYTP